MLAVASNLFGKSSSLAAYTLHSASPSGTPSSSSTNLASTTSASSFNVGLWKVVGATHKTTNKDVSVWIFEKRVLEGIRDARGKERVLEALRKEATSLSRMRHPDILHMVEPLEDSRAELTFVTELVTSSLSNILKPSERNEGPSRGGGNRGSADLDEVEIQKGILQIAKGLAFLHNQAKIVHLNLSPDAILVNAKGDWKLSGLSMTTPLHQPDGTPTKYVFPEFESRLPPQTQWKFDYLAPEYALDSQLSPSNDLYSLGCVLHAVHFGGKPPYINRGSMQSLRDNAEGPLVRRDWARGSHWDRSSSELKDLLPRLLTRHASSRLSLASLPSHPFFSSLAISTLNFLDPATFASKPREEKATFLRGLVRVLPGFSERLRKGKVLLSLLEEMKDPYLLPFILPNVFEISKSLSKDEFAIVLPKLQPLFVLKDPPQNMLTLLEHLPLFEEKTSTNAFRESVMPLIYNSLDSEHMPVQERVLKTVPGLCETLDYGTVQNVLLVKVAILFTKTRILNIKVSTLECFLAMVKTLDKATLTQKLVPLLAKIKTKEPAVMMATLAVHEAMGAKVDREAVAGLVLPQLWAMSMGPLLNADQFGRFMTVIKALGLRVEKEHAQHLRDVRRIEQQTAGYNPSLGLGSTNNTAMNGGGEVDFEALVKGNSMPAQVAMAADDPWGNDDGWGASDEVGLAPSFAQSLSFNSNLQSSPASSSTSTFPSQPIAPARNGSSSKLKARPVPPTAFDSSAFAAAPALQPMRPGTLPTLQPTTSSMSSQLSGPNYNLTLAPATPSVFPAAAPRPAVAPPPGWAPQSGLMQPTKVSAPAWPGTNGKQSDWGGFDPLL